MENSRIKAITAESIKRFFDRLQLPAIQAILPENRYNMDETGIMQGFGINGLVVGSAEKSSTIIRSPQTRIWTSIIECISATGRVLNPAIIFRGKNLDESIFPKDRPELQDWYFGTSKRGWTTNALALEWLQKSFLPQTAAPGQRPLLIFDGHQSHTTEEFMWECYSHDIYLLYLPPHSSHITQPLDVAVFSALKTAYRRFLSDLALQCDSSPIGKTGFLRCYCKARIEALTEKNIQSGWRATGLWPVNITKPLRNPFFPEEERLKSSIIASSTSEPTRVISVSQQDEISTPIRSSQILQQLRRRGQQSVTSRLVARKIGKCVDAKDIIIARQDQRIEALEALVEELRPKKKRRLIEDPNERFVRIWGGRDDQASTAATPAPQDGSEIAEDTEEIHSCIVVEF